MSLEAVAVEPMDPGSEPAQRILRWYFDELVGRYHGRGTGLGERLMHEVEVHARALGVRELRLDTRSDLVEAQRLCARIGYEPTTPFNHGTPADQWFRKRLA
jgi:GNAT superfamily N-acetyltransferase